MNEQPKDYAEPYKDGAFYWVKYNGNLTIGQFDDRCGNGGYFWIIGVQGVYYAEDFDHIGDEIKRVDK